MRKLATIGSVFLFVSLAIFAALNSVEGSEEEIVNESISLEVEINDHYAVTQYYTTFYNPFQDTKEVTFSFDKPDDSMLSNLSLEINGDTYYAKIKGKEIAEKEYDDAKEENKTATKVESQTGSSDFVLSLNIGSGNRTMVGLRFEQVIERSMDEYIWQFMMDSIGMYTEFDDVSVDILISSMNQITNLDPSGSTIDLAENWHDNRTVDLSWGSSNPDSNDQIEVVWTERSPPINGTMITHIDGSEGYFMHTFSPQMDELGGYMPKDIIFVLDRSGSMSGNKISQLKDAFDEIIHQIHLEDRFNVVYFNSVVDKYKDEIIEATEPEFDNATEYIRSLGASGGTNINEALLQGLGMINKNQEAVPILVFLTDGKPTSGVCSTRDIRENVVISNEQGASIYSLGFGDDLDYEFIEALSLENGGFAISIPDDANARNMMTGFYDTISVPLLKNIRFNYTGGSFDVLPTRLPSLFQGSEAVVVGRFDPDSNYITSTVKARTSQGERVFEENFDVNLSFENSHVPRMWAHRKIESLMNEMKVIGENESVKNEIISLAENYSFVTDYTSFILVLDHDEDEKEGLDQEENPSNFDGNSTSPAPGILPDDSVDDSDGDGIPDQNSEVPGSGESEEKTDEENGGSLGRSYPFIPLGGGDEDDSALNLFMFIPIMAVALLLILIISIFIYSRIRKDLLLEQENRKKIYKYIRENPGDYFRSIQRAVDLEVGTLSHHINILEKEQLLVSEQDGSHRRFYPAGVKIDQGVKLSRIQENILKSIKTEPGLTQSQIASKCGVSRKVVFYHVKFLRDTGAVREERVMRKPRYYPN